MLLVCDQVTESAPSEVEFQAEQSVQSNTAEPTEFTLFLKPSETVEASNDLEDDVEQSAGQSLNDEVVLILPPRNTPVERLH